MKIILCITGSIAATEDLKLIHELQRHNFDVECFMTDTACDIITPLSMEFASKHPVTTKLTGYVEHVINAKADLIVVAPATANTVSKFANKIADNAVTTLLLTANGYRTPILFVPSMHISMYHAIEDKINEIKDKYSEVTFLEPVNSENKAKFPDKRDIVLEVERRVSQQKLEGLNVVVATGATFEAIDDMRGITNRSSGKMGIELAKEAYRQGANVTVVCGRIDTYVPSVFERIDVESTDEMMEVIKSTIYEADIYISAAAISDFKIDKKDGKLSSDNDISVKFTKLPKVLKEIKEINPNIYVVGFKAEAAKTQEELIAKAKDRMEKYNTDLMIANDILTEGAGPGSDDNEVYIIDENDVVSKVELSSKRHVSEEIIDKIYDSI